MLRIWLVDDDEEFRRCFERLLGFHPGVRCTGSYGSAPEALQALASEQAPDVMLLDYRMPVMDGVEAVIPSRQLAPNLQIYLLTTFSEMPVELAAIKAGAVGVFSKVTPIEEVLEAVHRAVHIARAGKRGLSKSPA